MSTNNTKSSDNYLDPQLAKELFEGVCEITTSKNTDNEELKGLYGVDSDDELEEAMGNDFHS